MMMSGEVKTLKFAEDKPKDCKFCYYWGGKKKGPCIGWCTRDLLQKKGDHQGV